MRNINHIFLLFLMFLSVPSIGMDITPYDFNLADISALCRICKYAQLSNAFPFITQDTEQSRSHQPGSVEYFLLVNPQWCEALNEKDHIKFLYHCVQKDDDQMMEYVMSHESIENKKNRYEFLDCFDEYHLQYSSVDTNKKALMQAQKLDLVEILGDKDDDKKLLKFKVAISCGADLKQGFADVLSYGIRFKTLLVLAIQDKEEDIAQLLIRSGIRVNPIRESEKYIPLFQALDHKLFKTLKMLIDHPDIDINIMESRLACITMPAYTERSLLHEVCRQGLKEVVIWLLAHPKIDTQLKDGLGNIPANLIKRDPEIVALLKAHETSKIADKS